MNTTDYEDTVAEKQMIPIFYTILIIASTTFTMTFSIYIFALFGLANKRLHNASFSQIIQAPMAFFDMNLSGNILNRFSKDVNTMDEHIPFLFFQCVRLSLIAGGIIILVSVVKVGFFFVSIAFAVVLFICQRMYLPTSRSLKRLDGVTRSPVVGHLNASLDGLTTIRASGIQTILTSQFDKHQDLNSSASYMYISTNRAFGFYMDMLCVVYSWIIMFSLLIFSGSSAGKVGLALNLAFGLGTLLQYWIRQWTELENQMTSVERLLEYADISVEDKKGSKPENWPTRGNLEYKDVQMSYPKTNQLVLKGINFGIEAGQKIGIIGRTGAGKTSVISALFRLYDISEGSIVIDNINIKDIALENVRSKISIIPQNPVIFSGTLRSNLDPYGEYDDQSIWKTLDDVGLKNLAADLDNGLEYKIHDGGSNFSAGQKQLICLARAALRNNKVVVFDEATANIDMQTDILVQEAIKEKFRHCTILMIAHKLNTVLDSDKVMVFNNGQIVEYDSPSVLLNNKDSNFYYLVSQSGLLKR